MLTAAGNINQPYTVIGVVHATVSKVPKRSAFGASGGLPIEEAYQAVTASLKQAALNSGGDAVIHIGYDYRMATRQVGCNGNSEPVFEVYGWGTAVKLG